MGVNEFDHLPEPSRKVYGELLRRSGVALRNCRRRCRQLAFEGDIKDARIKKLESKIALLEARIHVQDMMLDEVPRGTVPRPREDS